MAGSNTTAIKVELVRGALEDCDKEILACDTLARLQS
jgi:hypothetical protein